VFWKRTTSPIVIPAELHEKLARTSKPIEEIDSEVLCVRQVRRCTGTNVEAADSGGDMSQNRKGTDKPDLSDAMGYEAHWQWYR
jgi:hypothetical protein